MSYKGLSAIISPTYETILSTLPSIYSTRTISKEQGAKERIGEKDLRTINAKVHVTLLLLGESVFNSNHPLPPPTYTSYTSHVNFTCAKSCYDYILFLLLHVEKEGSQKSSLLSPLSPIPLPPKITILPGIGSVPMIGAMTLLLASK